MPIEMGRRRGWSRLVLSLFVLPVLMGAKAEGCSYGGDVPIGSGSPDAAASCTPADCTGLPVQNDARICPDGTALGRTVCSKGPLGCGWDFAPCPEKDGGGQCGPVCDIFCQYGNVLDANGCPTCRCNPAPEAGACRLEDCKGLPATTEAKICPDGTGVGRTVCSKAPNGACGWDFPACPPTADGGKCGPVCTIFCQYGNVLDANGCPTCTCNPAPDAGASCRLEDCKGLPATGEAKICPDGTGVGRTVCSKGQNGACGWDFPPCPAADGGVADGGKCGPVCTIFCEHGNVLDANGCPTCACNPGPCGASGQTCCATSPNRPLCDGDLLCCIGLPYPDGGVCQSACLAK